MSRTNVLYYIHDSSNIIFCHVNVVPQYYIINVMYTRIILRNVGLEILVAVGNLLCSKYFPC